jgi:hypothetical protein
VGVTGPNHFRGVVKQEPWDGCAGNLRQKLSFRDEGKLCRACLKRTTADNTYTGKGGTKRSGVKTSFGWSKHSLRVQVAIPVSVVGIRAINFFAPSFS